MMFSEARVEFTDRAIAHYPGVDVSTEVITHYGRVMADEFGVENVADLEQTASALADDATEGMTLEGFVCVCLMIGYIAGTLES